MYVRPILLLITAHVAACESCDGSAATPWDACSLMQTSALLKESAEDEANPHEFRSARAIEKKKEFDDKRRAAKKAIETKVVGAIKERKSLVDAKKVSYHADKEARAAARELEVAVKALESLERKDASTDDASTDVAFSETSEAHVQDAAVSAPAAAAAPASRMQSAFAGMGNVFGNMFRKYDEINNEEVDMSEMLWNENSTSPAPKYDNDFSRSGWAENWKCNNSFHTRFENRSFLTRNDAKRTCKFACGKMLECRFISVWPIPMEINHTWVGGFGYNGTMTENWNCAMHWQNRCHDGTMMHQENASFYVKAYDDVYGNCTTYKCGLLRPVLCALTRLTLTPLPLFCPSPDKIPSEWPYHVRNP